MDGLVSFCLLRYHVTILVLPRCHDVTMLPGWCYHVTILVLLCYHNSVAMLPYCCCHVTMMLPCYHVTMLPCYHVTKLPQNVTMYPLGVYLTVIIAYTHPLKVTFKVLTWQILSDMERILLQKMDHLAATRRSAETTRLLTHTHLLIKAQ